LQKVNKIEGLQLFTKTGKKPRLEQKEEIFHKYK